MFAVATIYKKEDSDKTLKLGVEY